MAKAKKRKAGGKVKSAKRAAPKKVSAVPTGFHVVTPYLTMTDGARALEFYGKAFGAKVRMRMDAPGGRIGHAEIRIGDSLIMMSDEFPEQPDGTKAPSSLGGASGSLFLYVPNVDASFQRAVDAGCRGVMSPTDMFWGDRFARLIDPFGHHWGLATHKENVGPAEMKKRAAAAMAQMGQPA